MKNKKIKDERIVQLNNKIQSEAYVLVISLAAISIYIKSYVMDLGFSQFVVEFGIIFLSIAYIAVRSMLIGHDLMNNSNGGKAFTITSILALSLAISIINGIRNYALYGDKYSGVFDGLFISVLVITFISAAIFISVGFAILFWFNQLGQKRIEKILKEGEED